MTKYNNKHSLNVDKITSRLEVARYMIKYKVKTACLMPGNFYKLKKSTYVENALIKNNKKVYILAVERDPIIAKTLKTIVPHQIEVIKNNIQDINPKRYDGIWIDLCGSIEACNMTKYIETISYADHIKVFAVTMGRNRFKDKQTLIQQVNGVINMFEYWTLRYYKEYSNNTCPMRILIFTRK